MAGSNVVRADFARIGGSIGLVYGATIDPANLGLRQVKKT